MKQIPKHAELIKLWADGAVIQYYVPSEKNPGWRDCHNNLPTWSPQFEYRVKPEPKPDVVMYGCIMMANCASTKLSRADITKVATDNCMFVFDGETGKLKDAQVLANV